MRGRSFWRELGIAILATLIAAMLIRFFTGDEKSETVFKVEFRRAPVSAGHSP